MARVGDRILLVEGESDRCFFEEVCGLLKLPTVIVSPPKRLKDSGRVLGVTDKVPNNKEGVLRFLPDLLSQLRDNSLKRLSLIVDADYKDHSGLGYQATLERVAEIVGEFRFSLEKRPPQKKGVVFKHPDGLAPLGLWIMPDNQHDGSLEDFLRSCVCHDEQSLLERARQVVETLPAPRKFGETKVAKAEVSTWLAWQRVPGRGPEYALQENLFGLSSPPFIGLDEWLREIYS